jgi:acyl-CoA thioesterase YciA
MPADTNQYGDIFGGWLLDIAGGIFAANIAKSRTATVAVDAMTFRKPVYVGDVMCIYTDLTRVGRSIGRGAR